MERGNNMKKNVFLTIMLINFLGFSLLLSNSYGAEVIKIGIVDTYSGPAAGFSQDVLDGFKIVVNEVNARGGINGRKIEFVTRDDRFKPDIALAMAKELVLREDVDILMGTVNSSAGLAVSDFAKKEKVPFFCTNSRNERMTGEKGHRYVFGIAENTAMAGRAAAVVLAKKPYQKYYLAGDDYEYGHALTNNIWKHLKALKPSVQLVGEMWWKVGESDFTPHITKILAAKPDFLIAATSGASIIGFTKAAKATGLAAKIPFYQHTAIDPGILQPIGMDAPEGMFATIPYLNYYPDTPENRAFVETFRKAYGRTPMVFAIFGYVAGRLVEKGYEKAGNFDKEKFISALEGMVLDSPVGKIEMRGCDHQLQLPMMFGKTKRDPKITDQLIASDIIIVPYKDYMPTCQQILQLRK
ncbi:receptor family ligand-binding protein [delta proteobacterium NaphS2]|nr:receptor family ligand-binding protein [delta proteobacterium NaphS2]